MSANFELSGMNPDEFATSGFTLTQGGQASEDLSTFVHTVAITAPASTWNDLFHLKPDNSSEGDHNGADIAQGKHQKRNGNGDLLYLNGGLEVTDATTDGVDNDPVMVLPDLYDIDIFEEELIDYKTTATELEVDSLPAMQSTTATLAANTLVQNEVVSEACIKAWSKDLFQKEYMDDIWANRATIKTSIDDYLGQASAADRNAGIVAAIRTKIAAADGLKNREQTVNGVTTSVHQTTANLTRQLLLQLHAAVKGDAEGEKRLLNDEGNADSIFADANKAGDGYYAFLFKAGDTLSFGMTITHPNTYTGATGSINDSGVFDGSVPPRDMLFKVKITMQ